MVAANQADENLLGNNSNLTVVQELAASKLTVSGAGLTYDSSADTASVTIEADNNTGADRTVTFVAAVYNSNGKLIDRKILSGVSISSLNSYTEAVTLNCGSISSTVTVKIFAIENLSSCAPITAAWSGVAG